MRLDEFQRIQGDPSSGVFSTTPVDNFYFGVSLGGIMGLFNAAFNPHIERYNIDVGATNFALLLQRSTQFGVFELVFAGIGLTEPLDFSLGQALLHEIWASAEPAPYARYITGLVDEPLKIRAVDLQTGQELWNWQVRDTTYRGPFPP